MQRETPGWLDSDGLPGYLLGRPVANDADRRLAAKHYVELVNSQREGEASIWRDGLRGQVFLGDETFVAKMLALAAPRQRVAVDVPKAQRKSTRTLQQCLAQTSSRQQGVYEAYRDCGITMSAIARELGLSLSRVSRLVAVVEREVRGGCERQDLTPSAVTSFTAAARCRNLPDTRAGQNGTEATELG